VQAVHLLPYEAALCKASSTAYLVATSALAAVAGLLSIRFLHTQVPCLFDFQKLKMRRQDSAIDTTELFKRHDRQEAQAAAIGLDVKVLGVRCGSGLNKLDFALVHYRQQTPASPLCMEFLKVRLRFLQVPLILTRTARLHRYRYRFQYGTRSCLRCPSSQANQP
jgi:hypothetical protein